ncbi:structural maintenance of chromosomes protein 2-like protein [Leptotrombidium deliense]|uniref:Structural maintenance of chromosomes protein 2-like protein n=1 Tax=Leptotrombidium deliense TaxID=299467 RepID=A0A443SSP5_9ACAR|nr:structural maintenance of chromosomes protein 2-like protein [Leptotrombidium deliense]
MVEEATGVSMYELKKKSTQTIIERKSNDLRQIDSLIDETIKPKVDQLKKEQSGLLEYKKVVAELEHLNKKFIVVQFMEAESTCDTASATMLEKREAVESLKNEIADSEANVNKINEQIVNIEKQKDKECGGNLAQLEENLRSLQMAEAQQTSDLSNCKDSRKEEEKKLKQLEKHFNDDNKLKNSKESEFQKLKSQFDKLESICQNDFKAFKQAENDFEAISAGLSRAADGEAAATLTDQLMQAKKEIAEIDTESTKAMMKIEHCKQELSSKESQSKKEKGNYEKLSKEISGKEKELETLQSQMFDFDELKRNELLNNRQSFRRQIESKREECDTLEYQFPQSRFDYRDPYPNFDRRKVYGVVCNLFNVKDPQTFTALELAAGGKLYNVVVDNEETAKAIFEKGQPKRRCTLLPLSKIEGRDVDQNALRNAERLVGKENVKSAVSLIEYDKRFHNAMKYVFGDILVCPNMEIAKKVAFAKDVQKKTVTLDGEVFDPSGTLFGGFLGQRGKTLSQIMKIKENKRIINDIEYQLQAIEETLNSMNADAQRYSELKNKIDFKLHEISLLKERLQQTNEHKVIEEIEELRNNIKESEAKVAENVNRKRNTEKKVNDLQLKLKDSKSVREKELKEAKEMLTKAKKKHEKSEKEIASIKQSVSALKLEIDELEKSIESYSLQMKKHEENISEFNLKIDKMNVDVAVIQQEVNDANDKVKEQKKVLKAQSEEIAKLQKQKDRIVKTCEEKRLKIKTVEHEIVEVEKDSQEANRKLRVYAKKYPWIQEEKHLFIETSDLTEKEKINDLTERIQKLQSTKASLAKTVNMRANMMLIDKEKEAEELSKKRDIIENDKLKLIKYMEEVDQKKKDALHSAWEKINKDFGSIFSTLLPGSNAKLAVPEGKTVLDGLEVKVAFGGVWKESLTELSGGQRSLVALSLILALLLYNPAPIYILDEVDAALDQNHTQNIGNMIKRHFSKSQFIIVSLKDDMFNNANVLFKTKFVDGNSTVARFARSH